MHPGTLGGVDQQPVPFEPGVRASLTAEPSADAAADRQRQLAPGLSERQAAGGRGNTGDGLVEFLDQCCQLGALGLAAPDLLLLIPTLTLQAGQNTAALVTLAFQCLATLGQGLPVTLQNALLLGNLRAGLADL